MNMCLHGVIATGVETLRAELLIIWNVVPTNFALNGCLLILEIMVSYGWVILLIWMAWVHFSALMKKSNGIEIMGVFIKSTTCPKCLINLVIKLNT